MEPVTLKTDELKALAAEAGFAQVDEVDLYDIVFGDCGCCCTIDDGGHVSC